MTILKKFMKNVICLLLFCLVAAPAFAQSTERFVSCAAIFYNGKMLVDDYSPTGLCRLSSQARGKLSVHTVDLGPGLARAVGRLKFRVALRDGQTKTLLSVSDKTYREIDLAGLLKKCRPGDSIVILTIDERYALLHNEILIE